MSAAGEASPGAIDPAALAARISASLKAGLAQEPHVVACSPDLIGVLTTYLDSAAPMIAAAMERDRLAAELAAARAEVQSKDQLIAALKEVLLPHALISAEKALAARTAAGGPHA